MFVVVAYESDYGARVLVDRWHAAGEPAAILSAADLTRRGWRFTPGDDSRGRAIVGGAPVPTHEIRAVVTRMPAVAQAELAHIHDDDRAYAAAETNALLLAWLSSLRCPVLNAPTPMNLAGPARTAAQWIRRAIALGIPARPLVWTAEPTAPLDLAVTNVDASSIAVDVVGNRAFFADSGPDDPALTASAVALAQDAGAELVRVYFDRPASGPPRLIEANYWVDVANPRIADAVVERCLRETAAGADAGRRVVMIFLWGLAGDQPIATVRQELARLGRNAVLLDQRGVLDTRVDLTVGEEVSCVVHWDGVHVDLTRASAVYLRPYDPFRVPDVADAGPDSAAWRHALAVYEALRTWSELAPALVVNRLGAMASNGSKPYQAELIRASGFSVPETLVTTDPEEAAAFCDRHPRAIYKSVSGVRSIVSHVTADKRARLDAVAACPTQFQAYIAGVDHRVHVVGDGVHCCELVSDEDDYRYASRVSRRIVAIPDDVAERCRMVTRQLGLAVAGIDLRLTPSGEWVCFEVNPSPAFSWFDMDGRIGSMVASLLAAARPLRRV